MGYSQCRRYPCSKRISGIAFIVGSRSGELPEALPSLYHTFPVLCLSTLAIALLHLLPKSVVYQLLFICYNVIEICSWGRRTCVNDEESKARISCQDVLFPKGFGMRNRPKPRIRPVDFNLECCIEARFWKIVSTRKNPRPKTGRISIVSFRSFSGRKWYLNGDSMGGDLASDNPNHSEKSRYENWLDSEVKNG